MNINELIKNEMKQVSNHIRLTVQIFLLTIISVIIIISGCTKIDENTPVESVDKKNYPDQESWKSEITITKDGKRFAQIWAGYIAFYNEKKITVLTDSVHADFYDKNGKHNSTLTADSSVVHNQTNDLTAYGNVVVVSDSGIVLQTEVLFWDNEKQKIISEVPVKFTTKEDTLIGDSFVSNPDLTNYEIRNARGYSRRKIPIEK